MAVDATTVVGKAFYAVFCIDCCDNIVVLGYSYDVYVPASFRSCGAHVDDRGQGKK
jgi:hypothetical protein